MRHLFALVLGVSLTIAVTGCQNKNGDSTAMADACPSCPGVQKMTTQGKCEQCDMAADACPHCAGVQPLTADGKCPACGMKVVKK